MEKNLPCGESSPLDRLSCVKILHMSDCDVERFLLAYGKCGKNPSFREMWRKSALWRNLSTFIHKRNVDTDQFCRKICFVTVYNFLSQNMFYRDSRAYALGKIFACGEKRTNIRYALKLDLLYEIKLKLILESIL